MQFIKNLIKIIIFNSLIFSAIAADSTNSYKANYDNLYNNQASTASQNSANNGFSDSSAYFTVNITSPLDYFSDKCFSEKWIVSNVAGNSYFSPRIIISNEIIVSCIGRRGTVQLSAYGECKFIGTKRVCARFTPVCKHGNDLCCGSNSCTSNACPGCLPKQANRICAFDDPGIPFDLNDPNLSLMPFNENASVPPAVTGGTNIVALGAFLTAAGAATGFGSLAGSGVMLAGGVMHIVEQITSIVNTNVNKNVGCIDIPLAPSPPPFFSPLTPPYPTPQIMSICQANQVSTSNALCEVGGDINGTAEYSSFENPSLRVFFSNPIPLCGSTTASGDYCVLGQNIDTPSNLQVMNKSLLPICSDDSQSNCIKFPSGRKNAGPFRTYYKLAVSSSLGMVNNTPEVTPYVVIDPNIQSLSLTGIEDANYVDVAIGNTVNMNDINGNSRSFYAYLNDTGDQICLKDLTVLSNPNEIGCIARPLLQSPPKVAYIDGSSNPSAQPRISVAVGTPEKNGIIGVDTLIPLTTPNAAAGSVMAPTAFCVTDDITRNGTSTSNQAPCHIYASNFGAYITDGNNNTPDSTIDGTITPTILNGTYTGGLQYVKGAYCRGATKICLTGYSNPTQKVVAKIISIPNPNDPKKPSLVVSNKISDRIIPPANATLPLDPSTLFNPDINYYSTGTKTVTTWVYGFKDPTSGQYFENNTCSSNGISCTATSSSNPSPTQCTCTNQTNTTPISCTIDGCEWAFISSTTVKNKAYTGYTDGKKIWLLNDGNGYGERPLNSIEQGLCGDIPPPTCASITSPGVNDGNATWQTTAVGNIATGTCISGAKQGSAAPTRNCIFPTDSSIQANGCPTISEPIFTAVSNACGINIPSWWPSEFLYGQRNFSGAIVNQFNLTPAYMPKITPKAQNYTPLSSSIFGVGYNSKPEKWVTTGYNSCKNYGSNIDLNRTPRTSIDGDQEMLYITQDNWRAIWNKDWNGDGKGNDLTWLYADDNSNNGCYVYNVNDKMNFSSSKAVTVGLKICKSGHKVSFSLVDLLQNTATDYTNNAYIMQSNIIAYDYISTANDGWDNYIQKKTLFTNKLNPGSDQYPVNHGIVVDKSGFGSSATDKSLIAKVPNNFVSNNIAENIQVLYSFAGIYTYTPSGHNTPYHEYTGANSSVAVYFGRGLDQGTVTTARTNRLQTMPTCALSAYRRGVDYSKPINSFSYFAMPMNQTYSNQGNIYSAAQYTSPYISALYSYSAYRDNASDNEQNCSMEVQIQNYTPGNSAANPHMFLWSSPTNYNVCNP